MPLVAAAYAAELEPALKKELAAMFPEVAAHAAAKKQQEDLAKAISKAVADTIVPYIQANGLVTVTVVGTATGVLPGPAVAPVVGTGTGTVA